MNDGSYFFIKDADYLTRQSEGVFLVHNIRVSATQVFFYCHEYSQFWSGIDGIVLNKPIDFKKADLIPVSYETLLRLEHRAVIGGVARFQRGRRDALITF